MIRTRILLPAAICLLAACSVQKKFPAHNAHEVKAILAQYLPQLAIAPDDPALFDSAFTVPVSWCPQLSAPYWLIPSADLPAGVKPQDANNNVSICIFNNRLYVAFRTGPTHFASKKTGVYIISTTDGTLWRQEFSLFPGRDVREPFLLPVAGQLHFYCFAAGTKMTSFSPDYISLFTTAGDGIWNGPVPVLEKGEVHWSLLNRNGTTYLTSYSGSHYALKGESNVSLFFKQTRNGRDFSPVGDSACVYRGGASETAFEFDRSGNLWAVTRVEDGDRTGFGSHVAFAESGDLGNWQFPQSADPHCYQSPKLFRHGDEIYLLARKQLGAKPFGKTASTKSMRTQRLRNWVGFSLSGKTTALYIINRAERKVEWLTDLPGSGDTAFPSIQRLDAHNFLVANYSSPVHRRKKRSWLCGQLGNTGIYLQVISFVPCN